MKQIQQTSLTQQDIEDHAAMLEREHCVDLFLPADRREEVADDMLARFIDTFLE